MTLSKCDKLFLMPRPYRLTKSRLVLEGLESLLMDMPACWLVYYMK